MTTNAALIKRRGKRAQLEVSLEEHLPTFKEDGPVLVLRDVEELSNEETAEILCESVASIKSRAHRARMALREQLTRHWAVPRP